MWQRPVALARLNGALGDLGGKERETIAMQHVRAGGAATMKSPDWDVCCQVARALIFEEKTK